MSAVLSSDLLRTFIAQIDGEDIIKRSVGQQASFQKALHAVLEETAARTEHQLMRDVMGAYRKLEILNTGRANGKMMLSELIAKAVEIHRPRDWRGDMQEARVERMIDQGVLANYYTAYVPITLSPAQPYFRMTP